MSLPRVPEDARLGLMSEWYHTSEGRQRGPVSLSELHRLARSGELHASRDLVWRQDLPDWQPAGQVPEVAAGFSVGDAPPPPEPEGEFNPYAPPLADPMPVPPEIFPLREIPPGSQRLDAMACLKRGFTLANRHFLTMVAAGFIYVLFFLLIGYGEGSLADHESWPYSILSGSGTTRADVAAWLLSCLLSTFFSLGFTRFCLNAVSGRELSAGQLFGQGSKLMPALMASLLYWLAVWAGLVLLIVPGIWLSLRLGWYQEAMVDRNLGPLASLKYSWRLTRNSVRPALALGLVTILVSVAGVAALGVGVFYTVPVAAVAWVLAYRCYQFGRAVLADIP